MSALEQSLDAIIAKDRSANKKNRPQKPKPVPKAHAKARAAPQKRAPAVNKNKTPQRTAAAAEVLQTTTKVMVSGLPRDINHVAIKEFFNAQVGGVQTVQLAYTAQGKSSGNATVLFKNAKAARDAVAKYHNAPIDGGKSRLTMELVIDPSRKPLTARIVANKPLQARIVKKKLANKRATPGKVGKNVRGTRRPQKKSLEQLDAEMADYFSKNE